jgi:DnaJ-domain-containing protein 1
MQEDLEQINQEMEKILQELQRYAMEKMEETAKKALDPVIQQLLQNMGIDFSQIRGMASGQTALDPYRIIGLDRSASDDEVKKRYRELVYLLHPDTSGAGGTEHLFQTVMAAFELIKKERGW